MTRVARKLDLLLAAAAIAGVAQSQPALPAAFEVASVKLSKTGDARRRGIQFLPGGRVSIVNMPVQVIIASAFDQLGLKLESRRAPVEMVIERVEKTSEN
jgi:hypothetical protein